MTRITLVRILLLIIAYVISGRLSLLLAIPPGFTTAIFLPMGIAMGAAIIWGRWMLVGVFLGSTLLNLSLATAQGISVQGLFVASGIAFGSTLAIALGAYLVRSLIKFPTALADEKEIFVFMLCSGPIATLVSASVGPLVLFLNGIISRDYLAYSAWTWWVGDCIGILLAAPLMFVFFAKPRAIWSSRVKSVGLPVSVSCLLVVLLFVRSSNQEQSGFINNFHQQARLMSAGLKNTFDNNLETLQGLRALFLSSSEVTRADFEQYVSNINIQKLGISAISWNPWVSREDRPQFERQFKQEGFDEFRVFEADGAGGVRISPPRDYYVVVDFIEPWEANKGALGFNVAAEGIRRAAIEMAAALNRAQITAPINLIQDAKKAQAVLMFLPIHLAGSGTAETSGFLTAVIRAEDFVANALTNYDSNNYFLTLTDRTDKAQAREFFSNKPTQINAQQEALSWSEDWEFAGRKLNITFTPSQHFLTTQASQQSWYVLAAGLVFSSLLGAFLLLISGKTESIRNEVGERTSEISAILSNAFEAILVVNAKGIIIRANPAAGRLFSDSVEYLLGSPVYRFIPSLEERFAPVLNSLESVPVLDIQGRKVNGETLELELSISHLLLGGENVFTLIIHDISERAKIDKIKREFISTVSHELRTPLTSIKGSLGICLSGASGEMPESAKKMLAIASSNADRLIRLINDILDIDKLEFGQLEFKSSIYCIWDLLEQSLEQCKAFGEKYQVKLVLCASEEAAKALQAEVDPDRFLQVMFNLLSNAVKYSFAGGHVEVVLSEHAGQLKISVRDWGAGMPQEFRARIFQKFAQADSTDKRRRDGTGLGLSITKVIVERLGGAIDFTSEEGKGTEFWVTLPLVKVV